MAYLATLFFALVAGYVDMHNDEPQPAAVLILIGGFVIAYLARSQPQRWVLPALMASCIFVPHVVARLAAMGTGYSQDFNVGMVIIPMIPAYVGAAGAALARGLSTKPAA